MKICFIAPVPPFRGGIAKYCHSLAQELEKRHELLLISYQRQYPRILFGSKSQVDPDIDRERVSAEFSRLSYSLDSANPLSWRETSRQIASFGPDLVILPWWVAYWAPLYLYLLRSLRRQGIKVVVLCINVFEHEGSFLKDSLTRLVLSRAEAVVVHSEQERDQILRCNPGACVKKHLLPLFRYAAGPAAGSGRGLNLLFFGFVRPYKGLDTLLQALALLKGRDIALRIAGEFWNDKEHYLRLSDELGISAQVEIVDRYIPEAEMSSYFCQADLVVLPYNRSITSGIIATAYGYGKPVLATRVGGFHEVVQDGRTGKLVPPDDPQALAEGIAWFMEHQDVDFADNILKFTTQEMSWSSLADLIETFDR
jgi:glycosyltransferase involved in cell wall biosynthesis